MVQGADGNFYGTTLRGGNPANCTSGCGTVFKLTPQGILTTLFSPSFPSTQGEQPAGLMLATAGNFYGTTPQGGAHGSFLAARATSGRRSATKHRGLEVY